MTGQQIINRALIECASEGNRLLETGQTLQSYLEETSTFVVDDIISRWPFEWLNVNSTHIPTVPGQQNYTYPANMVEIIDIILDTGEIDTRKMKRLPLRTYRQKWAALGYQPMDKPFEWCGLNGQTFQVAPLPDSVYQMQLTGTQRPPAVTNFSVELSQIPQRYHETMAFGLAARGCSALRENEQSAGKLVIYEKLILQMIAEDKRMPDVEYEMKPFHASPTMFQTAYWANPFVRGIGSE